MASKHKAPPGASGAPKLDLENYKKFYGNGIPRWSPYYHVTVEGDLENQEQIRKFKEEGNGALPLFTTHEELAKHLLKMPDHKLNRMRDFGCGKPHWSPLYSEPAYKFESRAIEGDKISMQMTVPLPGEVGYVAGSLGTDKPSTASSSSSKPPSRAATRSTPRPLSGALEGMRAPDPLANTTYCGGGSARGSARDSARGSASARRREEDEAEARRIEDLLAMKQREIQELKEQLAKTKRSA